MIATAGGMVSDLVSFNLLLRHCTTVWLQADPEDHMARVAAQGDLRPMAASTEAMEDLKTILAGRAAFYSKADLRVDTSGQPLLETFADPARRGAAGARPAGLGLVSKRNVRGKIRIAESCRRFPFARSPGGVRRLFFDN